MNKINILYPKEEHILQNYVHQIRQTIDAYSIAHIIVGEALQNAMDAVALATHVKEKKIDIEIDLDKNEVLVRDNGIGFPPDTRLLFLGGGTKKVSKTTAGLVGVGIKVTMYCSESFSIKAKSKDRAWTLHILNADKFEQEDAIEIPEPFPEDTDPLKEFGTEILVKFSQEKIDDFMDQIMDRMVEPDLGAKKGFLKTIRNSKNKINPALQLMKCFLCRYTYAGDTLEAIGGRDGLENTKINLTMKCSQSNMGEKWLETWKELWGNKSEVIMEFSPAYLTVEDTVKMGNQCPPIYQDTIGKGGEGLEQTAEGFNVTKYESGDDFIQFKSLLTNKRGNTLPDEEMNKLERLLFPKINLIQVTIGHIDDLREFLPSGSRRVLSANGVVTEHDVDITTGQNQHYVRCIDIILDLDAELNYGKTHLKDRRLVGLTRDFVNETYRRTLQKAAQRYVGKMKDEDDEDENDDFWDRPDIEIPQLITQKIPQDENDVIGLFFELCGRGEIEGYKVFGLSQKDTYDSRMVIKRESDKDDLLENPQLSDLKTVEFKKSAALIVNDFAIQQKYPNEVDLIIAWDEGVVSKKFPEYRFQDIELSKYKKSSPEKVFPKVNRCLKNFKKRDEIQVLLLEDVIASMKEKLKN